MSRKNDDKLLKTLIKNLETDFRGFRQEVSKYQYVVDMTRVDHVTRRVIGKTLKSKYPKLKNYKQLGEDWTGSVPNSFLVLTSPNQVKTVNDVIKNATKIDNKNKFGVSTSNTAFTEKTFQGPASSTRQDAFILERSSKAKQALSSMVTKKTKEYLTLASPEFTAEFIDKVGSRLNKYTFNFNLADELSKNLKDKLVSSVTETFDRELKSIKPKTALNDAIEERVHRLGVAFETGKTTKDVKTRTRTTVKSSKKINTKKTYYTQLRSTSGSFISAPTLQTTLNILLHDIIQSEFMKSSGAAVNRDYLRYQTGRFARSARVDAVNYSGTGVIGIQYDYMTNPYETFTEENEHNGPGRNPERIISSAIRSILIRSVGEQFQAIIEKT